jgi:excisionase family DNA binding protein
MIGVPFDNNDLTGLGSITEVVADLVDSRDPDPALVALATQYKTTAELAAWIRSLPQRKDEGIPDGAGTAVRAPDDAGSEVLDVPAVARLLAVGRNTVYGLVARNAIPHRRLGKQIRFQREAVMRWLGSWSSQGAKEGH